MSEGKIVTKKTIEEFYIRLYFDTTLGFPYAAIRRAYRDFNRTVENIPQEEEERKLWRHSLYETLEANLNVLLKRKMKNQEEFTIWHKSVCYNLINDSNKVLTIGQAQKWVNMTLKYLYAFGNERVHGIEANYKFFHVPIDKVIQEKFHAKYGIAKVPYAWSKIKDYETYHAYQIKVRIALTGRIVMDEEFLLFNER